MVFVPVIVPHEEPSARARELSRRLEETIQAFERQYPGTSPADIRQAVRAATSGTGTARAGTDIRKAKLVMAVLAGVLGLGVGLFAVVTRDAGSLGGSGNPAMPWVVLGMIAAGLGMLIAIRRAR